VFVASLGDIWGPSEHGGVFRSRDGGQSWEHVLTCSPDAGAADLTMDPANPRVLFCTIWEAQRTPWNMVSGGAASSLWRSTDGGGTWEDLTQRPGFPRASLGRMGVTVSPAKRGRVWAQVEAAEEQSGVYRSEDLGETWHRVNSDHRIGMRPFYYMHIYADPVDPDTVWIANLELWRSRDGGATFVEVPTPHLDNHGLWIDPKDPRRLIASSDGGAVVSLNGGASWSSIYNQSTAQFYHCDIDPRFPYTVYGTQQDNTAVGVPSRTDGLAILWRDCTISAPSESGHIVVDPGDPDVIIAGGHGLSAGGGGGLMRYDHRTRELTAVTVEPELVMGEPADPERGRWQWTYPLVFSPHDPDRLYACGNRIHVTDDDGHTWQVISPDLTRADPDRIGPVGGDITPDNSGAEVYCTVFAFAESPVEADLLWAGTDDGRVWVRRGADADWVQVTPGDLREWTTVAGIEPSPADAATAYLVAHRYRLQDHAPYVARTTDFGATWERIDAGLGDGEITRVIRCDRAREGVLYLGTERGVATSFDDGATWQRLAGGLPVVPVHDLKVVDDALVVATHGRGFWICDDLGPLRDVPDAAPDGPHLFAPTPVYRFGVPAKDLPLGFGDPQHGARYAGGQDETAILRHVDPDGAIHQRVVGGGANPDFGVVLHYWLPEELVPEASSDDGDDDEADGVEANGEAANGDAANGDARPVVTLRVLDGEEEVASFTSDPPGDKWPKVAFEAGMNRFNWKLESSGARPVVPPTGDLPYEAGPRVPPGTYTVRLEVGEDHEAETTVEVRDDPRLPHLADAAVQRYGLLREIQELRSQVNDRVTRIKALRTQVQAWQDRVEEGTPLDEAATDVLEQLDELAALLVEERVKAWHDMLKYPPSLAAKLEGLKTFLSTGTSAPPTRSGRALLDELTTRAETAFTQVDEGLAEAVSTVTEAIGDSGLDPIDPDWSGRRRDRDPV